MNIKIPSLFPPYRAAYSANPLISATLPGASSVVFSLCQNKETASLYHNHPHNKFYLPPRGRKTFQSNNGLASPPVLSGLTSDCTQPSIQNGVSYAFRHHAPGAAGRAYRRFPAVRGDALLRGGSGAGSAGRDAGG